MNDFLLFQVRALLWTIRSQGGDCAEQALLRLQGYTDALWHSELITSEQAACISDLAENARLAFYASLGRDWVAK